MEQHPAASDTRTLTLYFVTLRRGQATNRYARQNPANAPPYRTPLSAAPGYHTTSPTALPATEDVLFPVPWRVQIELAPPPTPPALATGVPTQAYTNLNGLTNRLVTEMMPRGAYLIDELTGQDYRVSQHETDPSNPDRAVLTLDREVQRDKLDDDQSSLPPSPPPNYYPDNQPQELIRTVWVFPPAVEQARDSNGDPVFIGPQPVAGMEVRTMVISP
jgi:hypothetical protein